MESWELLTKAHIELFSSIKGSHTMSVAGSTILKSGIDNPSLNVFICERFTNSIQKDALSSLFTCKGLILSSPESREFVTSVTDKHIVFYRTGSIMTKRTNAGEEVHDIKHLIKVADNAKVQKDMIKLMSTIKKHDEKELQVKMADMFENKNIVSLIAYSDGVPVGYLLSVIVRDAVYSFEAATLEHFRASGVLSSLGDFGLRYGRELGATVFSSIITSEYSDLVVKRLGYASEGQIDLWISV